jgi:hypothetical protein
MILWRLSQGEARGDSRTLSLQSLEKLEWYPLLNRLGQRIYYTVRS